MNEERVLTKELEQKIISIGVCHINQLVHNGYLEDEEYDFNKSEISFLNQQNTDFFVKIARSNFVNDLNFNSEELKAMKDGLKEYKPHELVLDWSLGICDFEFDNIAIDFIEKNKSDEDIYEKLYIKLNDILENNRMNEEKRLDIIDRLEIMRGHGQFEGLPEDDMDFNELSNEELEWYDGEWIVGQFDED